MTVVKAAAVTCMLLPLFSAAAARGPAVSELPRLPLATAAESRGAADSHVAPGLGHGHAFHRHLMDFDVSAGVEGGGCGGKLQRCCDGGACDGGLQCFSGSCVKCGSSGRPPCSGGSPCGAGLVEKGGICVKDNGAPGSPGTYGGTPPAPPGCAAGLVA